jgi:hypothetical protein
VKDWLLDHLPESLATAFFSVLGWWMQRKLARADALEARVVALERDKVTKENIDELRESVVQQIANNQTRTEDRLERIWQHLAGGER